jgi:hypothetical protein
MSFWQEASTVVKASVVIGGLLIAYLGIAYVAGVFPYGDVEQVTQERGIQPGQEGVTAGE